MATRQRHIKCHEGDCACCTWCLKSNSRYIHPIQIKEKANEVYTWLQNNCSNLNDSSCICQPCYKQIDRKNGSPGFHPRWAPKLPKPNTKCCIEKCEQPVYTNTNLVTGEQIEQILHERVTAFSISDSQTSLALCQDHYLAMYRQIHHTTPCASCGVIPKKGVTFNRHCSDPHRLNDYLNRHVASNDTIKAHMC